MKKLSLLLILFFGWFCCLSSVYAEQSDFVYPGEIVHYFNGTGTHSGDYYNYTNWNNQKPFGRSNNPLGVYFNVKVESLANVSSLYHVKGSFTVNIKEQPILVPDQNLNSCLYLAQNSPNERNYLATCFGYEFSQNFASYENFHLEVIPSESISVSTAEDGNVSVDVNEYGYQYTFSYSFDFRFNEVNRTYYYMITMFTYGGYMVLDNNSVINLLITDPKIDSIPYFTAENSHFATFFNNLNFNMHGLSSVVTVPIAFVSNLSSNSSSGLNISVMNKNILLPNGISLFWGRSDVATFRAFWNIFFGGAIIYFVYLRLFKFVKKIFDPSNSEVTSL